MTATTGATTTTAPAAPQAQIAPPPKTERRPLLVVASIAAVAAGALGSVWAYQSGSDAQEVIAVRTTIERGQVIEAKDLMKVRITLDPALTPVLASESASVVGKRAALDLAAGTVVSPQQITATAIPADGTSVVGLSLTAAQLPAETVRVGDKARVVITTTGSTGVPTDTGETPDPVAAEVVGISVDQTSGNTVLNVQVSHDAAARLADAAAAGRVAVVLDAAGS